MAGAGQAADDGAPGVSALGATIRSARRRLGLSVQSLAQRAGVSLGLVSQLERGLGNPSLQSMQRLAAALGVPLGQLLDEPTEEIAVVRADRRYVLPQTQGVPAEEQAMRELLSPRGETSIQMIRTTLPPRFSNEGQPFRHIGTETVTVVSGELLIVHGEQRMTLSAGDTATYGCSTPHWWANVHDGTTVVLGAVTSLER